MPIIDSQQFLSSAIEGKFAPVYLFMGEEESMLQKCLTALSASYIRTYGSENLEFNIEKFYGDKESSDKVTQSCQTFPLLSEKKLVVLKHVERLNDSSCEQISAYLASPSSFTILALLWHTRIDKITLQRELPQAAAKHGVLVKCWRPFEGRRTDWIRKRCSEHRKKITEEAALFLSEEGGESLSELESEIEKTVLLIGEQATIQLSDLERAMSFSRNRSVWNLLDNLEKNELRNSIKTLEACLQQGEDPIKILNLIARWHRKKIVQGPQTIVGTDVPVRPIGTTQRSSPTMNHERSLEKILEEFKDADLKLKSGGGTESAVLEKLLLYLCKGIPSDSVRLR